MAVSVKTNDPCVDTELMLRTTGIEPELLRVIKYSPEDSFESDGGQRDGGIVSLGGICGLLSAIRHCVKHGVSVRRLKLLSFIGSALTLGALGIAAFTGVSATVIPLATVGVYYAASALLALLFSRLL